MSFLTLHSNRNLTIQRPHPRPSPRASTPRTILSPLNLPITQSTFMLVALVTWSKMTMLVSILCSIFVMSTWIASTLCRSMSTLITGWVLDTSRTTRTT
ncbi:hypothetical protein PILCRDRAFT_252407 [Piloderma croceum F 1598]|uniref:Uncharacterized protein n=1 Tax=Piloderma croceum (strain F 1598) TaxID=765440 RepID=A0A0C3G929_PILCF|nr:hypothetical protein PILCRDRAFT_252407 [Piloderma croceum F 1598]